MSTPNARIKSYTLELDTPTKIVDENRKRKTLRIQIATTSGLFQGAQSGAFPAVEIATDGENVVNNWLLSPIVPLDLDVAPTGELYATLKLPPEAISQGVTAYDYPVKVGVFEVIGE